MGNFLLSAVTAAWGPVLGVLFLVFEYNLPVWKILAAVLIGIAALNFLGLLGLEPTRQERPLTLIAFVFMILIMLLLMVIETLEEQAQWFRAEWFDPVVMVYLVFLTVAIFRERYVMLKFYLSLNGLVLALCWGGLLASKISFLHL